MPAWRQAGDRCLQQDGDEKTVNYFEKGHNEIKNEISNFLKRTGFNTDTIPHVPISGFNSDNMIEQSKNMPWYKGRRSLRRLTSPGPCPPS